MEVYQSSKTAAEMEYALSAVPSIGDNGNWFIGDQDTGIFAAGVNVSGAEPGQVVKIKEVNEAGMPTAWEAADFSSGDEVWDILMNVTAEEDVTQFCQTTPPEGHSFDEYTEFYIILFLTPNTSNCDTLVKLNFFDTNAWFGNFVLAEKGITDSAAIGRTYTIGVRKTSYGFVPTINGASNNTGGVSNNLVIKNNTVYGTMTMTYAAGAVPTDLTTALPNGTVSVIALGSHQKVIGAGSKAVAFGKRKA